jgi:cytochrome c oxidase subunit 2
MRGHVVVDNESNFSSWLENQNSWADVKGIAPGDSIKGAAQYAVCSSCHGLNGEGSIAMNSPRIAGLPDWYIERQLSYYKQGIRGSHEKDIYGQQMAAMSNALADDSAIRDVAAYIQTLKPELASPVLRGDAARGMSHYTSCGACHGAKGQGNFALQAPALAGQNDWYLKRQLEHFRLGIRGTHEDDNYGHQMVLMARSLQNEQSIDDLLAYLSGL